MTNKKSRLSEKLKKFAERMRQTQRTNKNFADESKKPKPIARAPAKPKAAAKKELTERTLDFIEKRIVIKEQEELPAKKLPAKKEPAEKTPKETPTPRKEVDDTELQNQYKAETGKNAIWRGQETKGYIDWKQKQLNK